MNCKNCGAEIPNDSKFCKNCGNKVDTTYGFCGECGTEITEISNFCAECGAEINIDEIDVNSMGIDSSTEDNEIDNEVSVSLDGGEDNNNCSYSSVEEVKNEDMSHINSSEKKTNSKLIGLFAIIIVLLIVILSFTYMDSLKPLEVTYENYPDISKEVIDSFNKWDKNNDSFVSAQEYSAYGYSSVWDKLEDKGYVNHTAKYKNDEIPAMDIGDYNRAYNLEQKLIKKEYDKRKAIEEENKVDIDWEQDYQNWYSKYGNPSLSDKENRQQYNLYVSNKMNQIAFGPSYGYTY